MRRATDKEKRELWDWTDTPFKNLQYIGHQLEEVREKKYPNVDVENLNKYVLPKVLHIHSLIEQYTFKQASKWFYSEAQVWDKKTYPIEVLKGTLVATEFCQNEDAEEVIIWALFWTLFATMRKDKETDNKDE
ncbi:hypothetical protein LCGC14_0902340 [marine sediment metagenome]|uniref:Uncharacterized protein n=1 Tax=marine sediment metagenome TaxID=412755 RepID=A0A0F9P0X3_9ZZZZ